METCSEVKQPHSTSLVLALPKRRRKNRKKDKRNRPYLPMEVFSSVLHWLPADFLYGSARYVCKTWNELLYTPSFIRSHQLHSVSGFIVENLLHYSNEAQCVSIKEWELQETNVFPESTHFLGHICGSADGVLLISDVNFKGLFVANPITRQVLKLPCLPTLVYHFGIASVPPIGALKVVGLVTDVDESVCLYILILGKEMTWRKITIAAPGYDKLGPFETDSSLMSVDGVIYKMIGSLLHDKIYVLAIDLRDESTHHLKLPLVSRGRWTILQMKKTICVVHRHSELMKVFMLKDLQKKEWVMLKRINFFVHPNRNSLLSYYLFPLIWLESEQVMVLGGLRKEGVVVRCPYSIVVACCLKTGKVKSLQRASYSMTRFFHHTPSLAWF